MLTVTYNGMEYKCATAYRGEDSVRLVDENGVLVADFEGVCDFSAFTCVDENGESHPWIACPKEDSCYPVLIGEDNKARKSSRKFRSIAKVLDYTSISSPDPETGATADTPENWRNLGFGVAPIDDTILRRQPCSKGYLLNLVAPGENPNVTQLLISFDVSEPCKMWMRKNLIVGEATMDGYKEIVSTTEWEPGQYGNYWQQLLSDTDRAKTVSIAGCKLTEDYHFGSTAVDYFFALNAPHYWPVITGNLGTYVMHPDTNMERVSVSVGPDIALVKVHANITCLAWSEDIDVTLSIERAISNGLGGFTTESYGQVAQRIHANKSGTLAISNVIDVYEGDALYLKVTSSSGLTLVASGTQCVVEAIG